MKVGELELRNNIFLAPMAGVTDKAYRIICSEMGAGLLFSEMVSSKGLYYKDKKTDILTSIDQREGKTAIQIFGSDPEIMAYVVEKYLNPREDIVMIDINMGCPAPKIVKNGDGSALMKNPSLVRKILRNVVRSSNKLVSLKIRKGWDDNNINGLEIAKIAEEEGISLLTVHGRTREMFYSGKADWQYIKEIKRNLKIPVIGNGDIFTVEDGIRMIEETNCDGIAIGRGVMGNPWIFKNIENKLKGKKYLEPSLDEKIDMILKHLELICTIKGDKLGIREMRKHIGWYIKGMESSNKMRDKINKIDRKEELVEELLRYKEKFD